MSIKPKHLILNLLSVADRPIAAQQLIGICKLFAITANNARVTLARLTADGMVETSGRGRYQLGAKASTLAENLSHWREFESQLCCWQGDWIGVYIGALGRTDRTGLRRRTRVLQLAGFEPLEPSLWLRPNNLSGGVAHLRQRLQHLGLELEARVMRLDDFSANEQQQAIDLWDVQALCCRYRQETAEMRAWMDSSAQLSAEDGARQSFLLGDRVLRNIVFDPLLPEQMIDVELRATYIATMVEYDRIGNTFFETMYRRLHAEA